MLLWLLDQPLTAQSTSCARAGRHETTSLVQMAARKIGSQCPLPSFETLCYIPALS